MALGKSVTASLNIDWQGSFSCSYHTFVALVMCSEVEGKFPILHYLFMFWRLQDLP